MSAFRGMATGDMAGVREGKVSWPAKRYLKRLEQDTSQYDRGSVVDSMCNETYPRDPVSTASSAFASLLNCFFSRHRWTFSS